MFDDVFTVFRDVNDGMFPSFLSDMVRVSPSSSVVL
jgi:hypothetical protein